MKSEARLTVVSGPTAVGKGTVVARLAKQHPEIFVSVSVTTRPPRRDEIDGLCATIGAQVTVSLPDGTTLEGRADRLDEAGRLVVVANGAEVPVAAGDVTHVRGTA